MIKSKRWKCCRAIYLLWSGRCSLSASLSLAVQYAWKSTNVLMWKNSMRSLKVLWGKSTLFVHLWEPATPDDPSVVLSEIRWWSVALWDACRGLGRHRVWWLMGRCSDSVYSERWRYCLYSNSLSTRWQSDPPPHKSTNSPLQILCVHRAWGPFEKQQPSLKKWTKLLLLFLEDFQRIIMSNLTNARNMHTLGKPLHFLHAVQYNCNLS